MVPGYFDRFPSKEDYEGCKRLISWYGAKYPGLRAQWEERMYKYELAQSISVDM